jgi:hypothetical protein
VASTMQRQLRGGAFANARWGRGLGVKNPKWSRRGWVPGPWCQMAVEGGGGRWWDGTCDVAAIAGRPIHKREAGGGG